MSPTNRTLPFASGGRFIVGGNIMKPCWSGSSMSADVYTATTPGAASASLVSIDSMLACATVERTNATCSNPSMSRSSKYSVAPVRMPGSSLRRTGLPRIEPDVPGAMVPPAVCGVEGGANTTECNNCSVLAVRNTEAGVRVVDVDDVGDESEGHDEVRVAVRASGICGSDLEMVRLLPPGPITLGHEFAGVLADGRAVAVQPTVPCGTCDRCAAGEPQQC